MCVTDIRLTRRGRFAVYGDGEFCCTLHPEVYARSHLQVGDVIEPSRLGALCYETEEKLLRERALNLLSAREYTRRQLCDKLVAKGAEEEMAAAAASRMEELGLLDDAGYACRAAADMARLKGYAPRRITQELRRRGLSEEDIAAALDSLEEENAQERIAQILLSRYARLWEDEKVRRRAVAALQRMGYSYEDIRFVAAHIEDFIEP
ncbi:MAG: regulatory protein RecX [Provencibacterium sp.]|jgi:regulatory protein|nr:regulatory protein RecX [Provencibacterium sp.]